MFVVGSRFNHDCSPNVHRTWLPDEGVEVYHATRDVEEGTELCGESGKPASLSFRSIAETRGQVRALLPRPFGAARGAPAVRLRLRVRDVLARRRSARDERREPARVRDDVPPAGVPRLLPLPTRSPRYRALYAAPPTDPGALDAVRRLLEIADREFDSPAMTRRVLHDGVITALQQGRVAVAAAWMKDLYDAQLSSSGDCAVTRRFAAYRADVTAFRPSD
jgi:hypothetical protein